MVHSITTLLAFGVMFAVCGLGVFFGSAAERLGALVVCFCWMGDMIVSLVLGKSMSPLAIEYTYLAVDGFLAVGLLFLSLKFAKVWLGIAMLLQSAELALHGAEMADFGLSFRTYMFFNNIVSWSLLLLLAFATLSVVLQNRKNASSSDAGSASTLWVSNDVTTASGSPLS